MKALSSMLARTVVAEFLRERFVWESTQNYKTNQISWYTPLGVITLLPVHQGQDGKHVWQLFARDKQVTGIALAVVLVDTTLPLLARERCQVICYTQTSDAFSNTYLWEPLTNMLESGQLAIQEGVVTETADTNLLAAEIRTLFQNNPGLNPDILGDYHYTLGKFPITVSPLAYRGAKSIGVYCDSDDLINQRTPVAWFVFTEAWAVFIPLDESKFGVKEYNELLSTKSDNPQTEASDNLTGALTCTSTDVAIKTAATTLRHVFDILHGELKKRGVSHLCYDVGVAGGTFFVTPSIVGGLYNFGYTKGDGRTELTLTVSPDCAEYSLEKSLGGEECLDVIGRATVEFTKLFVNLGAITYTVSRRGGNVSQGEINDHTHLGRTSSGPELTRRLSAEKPESSENEKKFNESLGNAILVDMSAHVNGVGYPTLLENFMLQVKTWEKKQNPQDQQPANPSSEPKMFLYGPVQADGTRRRHLNYAWVDWFNPPFVTKQSEEQAREAALKQLCETEFPEIPLDDIKVTWRPANEEGHQEVILEHVQKKLI